MNLNLDNYSWVKQETGEDKLMNGHELCEIEKKKRSSTIDSLLNDS